MKLAAVIVVTVAACGAGVSSKPVNGPDGEGTWWAISCKHQADCFEEAGVKCVYGYRTAERSTEDGARFYADKNIAVGVTVHEGTLLVKCLPYRGSN